MSIDQSPASKPSRRRLATTRANVSPSQFSGEEMCPFLDASCRTLDLRFVLAEASSRAKLL
jgi:hypothetical protein